MTLTFLLDEHLRGIPWKAIEHHNRSGGLPIDAVRVGDPADLPLGSLDPDILVWAERHGRILLSLDRDPLPDHFLQHLQAGRHSPGLLLIDPFCSVPGLVGTLELIAHAGNPADYFDQIGYIP
jgi:Domain of unknown function (DUF5615)